MPRTPLVPAIPPLAAMLGADALAVAALGLARVALFPEHALGTRLVGALHVTLAFATLTLSRATATGRRRLVARAAALTMVASAAALFVGPDVALALDGAAGGATRELAHAALLALACAYAFVTSPARRPLRSESPTSRA